MEQEVPDRSSRRWLGFGRQDRSPTPHPCSGLNWHHSKSSLPIHGVGCRAGLIRPESNRHIPRLSHGGSIQDSKKFLSPSLPFLKRVEDLLDLSSPPDLGGKEFNLPFAVHLTT